MLAKPECDHAQNQFSLSCTLLGQKPRIGRTALVNFAWWKWSHLGTTYTGIQWQSYQAVWKRGSRARRGQRETRTTCLGTGTTLPPGGCWAPHPLVFRHRHTSGQVEKKKNGLRRACEQREYVTEPVIGNNPHVGESGTACTLPPPSAGRVKDIKHRGQRNLPVSKGRVHCSRWRSVTRKACK